MTRQFSPLSCQRAPQAPHCQVGDPGGTGTLNTLSAISAVPCNGRSKLTSPDPHYGHFGCANVPLPSKSISGGDG